MTKTLNRVRLAKGSRPIASAFPNINFCGVFLPLKEGIARGIIGTKGFDKNGQSKKVPFTFQTNRRPSRVPITFQATASPTQLDVDLRTIRVLQAQSKQWSAVELERGELRLLEILVKILSNEWSGIYPNMEQRESTTIKRVSGGDYANEAPTFPTLVHAQRWWGEIKDLPIIMTFRGYTELNALDFGVVPEEPDGANGPVTVRPSFGRKHNTIGWQDRKGGR